MKTLYQYLAVAISLSFLFACQPPSGSNGTQSSDSSAQASAQVAAPLPDQDLPFQQFEVATNEEQQIELSNGSLISIPAGSLLGQDGQPITGMATIQYREFHDVVDVLFSGIPMTVQNEDKQEIFQTAGMMEIRGVQNGQPLQINPEKPITVEMASYRFAEGQENLPQGYGQYYLDQNDGQWETLAPLDTPQTNPRRAQKFAQVPQVPTKPFAPQKPKNANQVFNFAVDYSDFPQLAGFQNVVWEYAGINEQGSINPNQNSWIFGEAWQDADIKSHNTSKNTYFINLTSRRKEASIIVRPVVEKQDFAAAMEVYKKRQKYYQAQKDKAETAMAEYREQSKMVSIFSALRFGIYNIDRYLKIQKPKVVQSQMVLANVEDQDAVWPLIYHVIEDANAVIPYDAQNDGRYTYAGNDFRFFPEERNYLVAIHEGQLYVYSHQDFRTSRIGDSFVFNLNEEGEASRTALRALL